MIHKKDCYVLHLLDPAPCHNITDETKIDDPSKTPVSDACRVPLPRHWPQGWPRKPRPWHSWQVTCTCFMVRLLGMSMQHFQFLCVDSSQFHQIFQCQLVSKEFANAWATYPDRTIAPLTGHTSPHLLHEATPNTAVNAKACALNREAKRKNNWLGGPIAPCISLVVLFCSFVNLWELNTLIRSCFDPSQIGDLSPSSPRSWRRAVRHLDLGNFCRELSSAPRGCAFWFFLQLQLGKSITFSWKTSRTRSPLYLKSPRASCVGLL